MIMIISGLYIPRIVPLANAAFGGEVCIAQNGATACPTTVPLISSSPAAIPSQIRIAIVIDGSDGINGFDITLLTNSTVLKPAGYSIAGTILQGSPAALVNCIGDVGVNCGARDTADTLHISISVNSLTTSPITGLLFTAIYNITGVTYNTPIAFQIGCNGTSVGGDCVSITNGSTNSLPETDQTAKFTNQPYFDLQPTFGLGSVTVDHGGSNLLNPLYLNVTSINSFTGTVSLTASVLPPSLSTPTLPSVSITVNSVTVSPTDPQNLTTAQVVITVADTVTPQVYTLNFTGVTDGLRPNILQFPLIVPSPDFSAATSKESLSFNVTSIGDSTITLSTEGNFSGIVSLTLQSSSGLNASLSRTSLNLPRSLGGATSASNSTLLRLNSTIAGTYSVTIIAASGSLAHNITILVTVLDFLLSVPPTPLIVAQGTTAKEPVSVGPSGTIAYNTTVTLTRTFIAQATPTGTIAPSTGISVACNPSTVDIYNVGTSESSFSTNCFVTGIQIGSYTVTVIASATSGGRTSTHAVVFDVSVVGPDFTIVPSTYIQVVPVGRPTTISITFVQLLNLNSSINLVAAFPPSGTPGTMPTATISPVRVLINSTYPNATAIVTITTSGSTATGTYFLEVIGSAPVSQTSHLVVIAVVVTFTTSPHDLEVYSVTPSTASATVGSSIDISIVVVNLGRLPEDSTVLALVGELSVGNQTFTDLEPGDTRTFTIKWNTDGFTSGSYTIGGQVMGVPGQTDLAHNILRSSTPVTLNPANTGIFQSGYVEPTIIIALAAVLAIILALLFQARRRKTVH